MSSAKDFFAGLGMGSTFTEQVAAIKAEHGKNASHVLADMLGKSLRQAQRYIKGDARPAVRSTGAEGLAALQETGDRARAVDAIRSIRRVSPGTVAVEALSSGKADGTRQPGGVGGWLDVAGGMSEVADAYAAGRDSEAADLFAGSIIAAYGGENPADRSGFASYLGISDYQDGIEHE